MTTTVNSTIPSRTISETKPVTKTKHRGYLTPEEVDELITIAKTYSRYGHRDSTMILMAYRHGLRVSELCGLQWSNINLDTKLLCISNRTHKHGNEISIVHPLYPSEVEALQKLQQESPASPYLFMTERGTPMTTAAFRRIFSRIGSLSSIPFPIYPHILRHSCGYKLAHDGRDTRSIQQYLGHLYIQHTARYTARLPTNSFHNFWED